MTDETKKLFDAPWEVCLEKRGSFYRPCICSSDTKIASVCTKENANRLARLPELYEAFSSVIYEDCHSCLESYIDRCMIPERSSMVENGCPKKEETCFYRKYWELLKKVRDGE